MRQFNFIMITLITAPTVASTQSVLERVLRQLDGATNIAQVNGTYANIAETLGSALITTSIHSDVTNIDGSISNIVTGLSTSTQESITELATATEWEMLTLDLGDMATTALGAINTGETFLRGDTILGVNSVVGEALTSTTHAISATMKQIGSSSDSGALVLNVAYSVSTVNGSIQNTLQEVNGSVGDLSTIALGAVNTGTTITSVIHSAVQGIIGISGQSGSGL